MHNKKVAEEKAKSRSLINASLLWHFENKSQVADFQEKIKHQNNENKRIQNRLRIKHKVALYFKKNEFIKNIEGLRNIVQVLQNELMEKDSEIHLMKKQQELQELELRKELRMKEAAEDFIRKSSLMIGWLMEKMSLAMDLQTEQLTEKIQIGNWS